MRIAKSGLFIALLAAALVAGPVTSVFAVTDDEVPTIKLWKLECSGISS